MLKDKIETSQFNYTLPDSLIAHSPATSRSDSKLMCLSQQNPAIQHDIFSNLQTYLRPGDVLILNNTQVIHARLYAKRHSGAKIELLLLEKQKKNVWTALIKNSKKLHVGESLTIASDFSCTLIKKNPETGICHVQLHTPQAWLNALQEHGEIPLPPYIHTDLTKSAQEERYQTIVAKKPGSVAAPTAGLHFTKKLLSQLKKAGIQIETVTLHVGYGTFKPIQTEYIQDHVMHEESYYISPKTAERLTHAHQNKQRFIAVGTTSARTLESALQNHSFKKGPGKTKIFIYPGYTFKAIQGLITNFHLPQSSLLCLVSALIGISRIQEVYQIAIKHQYRFYSFGDAMIILP
ncbi:MAG: tRNA preQ1(34) S-adenosylmethionine ribosyltransferase-isomerase QueA [Candidatus Margulisbacteria bacterium]|nr:tRNA preQ1(34) S-adenosylmethionine ribosyltransferase-isomerase QueA [Candidatus Margulisiibacteriota bacterium]